MQLELLWQEGLVQHLLLLVDVLLDVDQFRFELFQNQEGLVHFLVEGEERSGVEWVCAFLSFRMRVVEVLLHLFLLG